MPYLPPRDDSLPLALGIVGCQDLNVQSAMKAFQEPSLHSIVLQYIVSHPLFQLSLKHLLSSRFICKYAKT